MPILLRIVHSLSRLIALMLVSLCSIAQDGVSLDLKKPKEYETKVLRSERSGEKKFTIFRRLFQNMFSHYNYYFNANNKLNTVIEKAKSQFKDDYSKILPFYNYTIEQTATDSKDLDSVILKATTGILLHDLRSDWTDNHYLLIGKAYLFRKEFDSAEYTFQYINYNFHPSRKNEYRVTVGSNTSAKKGQLAIMNDEANRNVLSKAFSMPPSRNDALLWQVRNYIEMERLADASSLLITLKNDANFPKRLTTFFHELYAYWFYKQEIWDSTVLHLEKALDNATSQHEKSRWEFLLGQLYSKLNQNVKADSFYTRSIRHTTDLMLEIQAKMNKAQLVKADDIESRRKTIADLLKLAKRDRFEEVKDVLYFSAAKIYWQMRDTINTLITLNKAIKANAEIANAKPKIRNTSYLLMSDIKYLQKDFISASACYDSLVLNDVELNEIKADVDKRKIILATIAEKAKIIYREDSLQALAKLSEDERNTFLKNYLKKIKKVKGKQVEDEEQDDIAPTNFISQNNQPPQNLFDASNKSGEWYFYNPSSKAKGFNEFKVKWGKRPNVDNWRRQSVIKTAVPQNTVPITDTKVDTKEVPKQEEKPLNLSLLLSQIPLTDTAINKSNQLIIESMFTIGSTFKNQLEDYVNAAETFEALYNRFNSFSQKEETIFNLFYCWQKAGNEQKAGYYKGLLKKEYPKGKFTEYASINPASYKIQKDKATKKYEEIYDLLLSGEFKKALDEKKKADSIYGQNFWTPQLLYIESIYYIKENKDSNAIVVLNKLTQLYPNNLMSEKAKTMIDVLKRRKEIEDHLTKLKINRYPEDTFIVYKEEPLKQNPATILQKQGPIVVKPKTEKERKDSIDSIKKPVIDINTSVYIRKPDMKHYVLMILNRVDKVFTRESQNSLNRYNTINHSKENLEISNIKYNDTTSFTIFSSFASEDNAVNYAMEMKQKTRQIIPWLDSKRYSFIIISEYNLELLKLKRDLKEYRQFLEKYLPGKFGE